MQLIPNAAQAHKLISVQIAIAAALFNLSYLWLPILQARLTPAECGYVNFGLAAAMAIARVLKQNGLAVPDLIDPSSPAAAAAPAASPSTTDKVLS